MTNAARQALREIIAKYGTEICSDEKRCEGLLKDKCGSHRREISVLINALEERVPLDLLASQNSVPRELLLNRLSKRLESNLAITENAALWAVESWALALNIITEREIAERENARAKAEAENEIQRNEQNLPPATETQKQPQSQKKPPIQPPVFAPPPFQPPQSNAPLTTQGAPTSAPPVPIGKAVPQVNQSQAPAPQMQPKKRSRRFGGCFIGCFLLLILLGILVVGVPYTIRVMQETQQTSPPRRPPQ